MSRRASLTGRLARLEAQRPARMTLPLEDGRTLSLNLMDALSAVGEGIRAVVAIQEGEPFPDPSPTLRRLGHVRADAADSLLGGVLIESARAVRAHLEGATRP